MNRQERLDKKEDSFFPSPHWGEGRVRGKPLDQGSSILRHRARRLRRGQTEAELRLWMRIRSRQLGGAKFRRQHPVGRFITDFCCPEENLVIELDGGQHTVQMESDLRKTAYLSRRGYRVLRFWDNDVMGNIEAVLLQIVEALSDPHPDPLPKRERANK